jgi:hypothetical protein
MSTAGLVAQLPACLLVHLTQHLESTAYARKWTRQNLQEAALSSSDPITFRPRLAYSQPPAAADGGTAPEGERRASPAPSQTRFDRLELNTILNLYGKKVASGEWRDYAIDFNRDTAVFSVFRHTSQCPLYRIEKNPKLARRQGAYSVVTPTGLILKRGPDLARVLAVLDKDKGVRVVEH